MRRVVISQSDSPTVESAADQTPRHRKRKRTPSDVRADHARARDMAEQVRGERAKAWASGGRDEYLQRAQDGDRERRYDRSQPDRLRGLEKHEHDQRASLRELYAMNEEREGREYRGSISMRGARQ